MRSPRALALAVFLILSLSAFAQEEKPGFFSLNSRLRSTSVAPFIVQVQICPSRSAPH